MAAKKGKKRPAAKKAAKPAAKKVAAKPRKHKDGGPAGWPTLSPYMAVRDGQASIEFYAKAFGARERNRHMTPDGAVMHAEMKIGDSILFLADEFPGWGVVGPQSLGGSPVTLHLYVKDVDAAFQRALDAGAVMTMPVMDQFWGDRYGKLKDPFGHDWSIASRREIVGKKEMERRGKAAMEQMKAPPAQGGEAAPAGEAAAAGEAAESAPE